MRTVWRWAMGLSFLPLVLGGLVWLVYFHFGWLPDYMIYSRVSLGVLALLAGSILTALLLLVVGIVWRRAAGAEARLAQSRQKSEAQHDQFLFRLDHELKNPLTSLQVEVANLEAIAAGLGLDRAELGVTVGRLKVQAGRLSSLVLQLRKLAELNTQTIQQDAVDLTLLLRELDEEYRRDPEGAERKISVVLPEVPWPLAQVRGDADLLYLALFNVLGNAVKFSRPGDSIQVRGYEDGNAVVLEVADTGLGIPAEEAGQVWDELFRGKMARGMPGSGLGLALVRAIVERHGGEVSLQSRLDQGTIVKMRLPSLR